MLKVLGLGDNVVDVYLHQNLMYPGGNAVNFAVFAKELGLPSSYLGIYGNDEAGKHIQKVLKDMGIDQQRCLIKDGENGYSAVNLIDGDRVYVGGNDGGISKLEPLKFTDQDIEYISKFDLLHSSCYSHIEPELPKIKTKTNLVSFDFSNRFNLEYGKIVCPHIDIALISCGHLSDLEIEETTSLAHSLGCKIVLSSMGRRGARLSIEKEVFLQASGKEKAIDSLGAGDAFFTAFIVNYLSKKSQSKLFIEECLQKAADFATLICMRDGAFGHGIKYSKKYIANYKEEK